MRVMNCIMELYVRAQCDVISAVGARQHVDQLVHFAALLTAVAAGDRVLDAVADMILQNLLLDSPQRSAHRRNLREDVNAVAVALDHAGDSADLALDSIEAAKA
jgi:hypothetical protein